MKLFKKIVILAFIFAFVFNVLDIPAVTNPVSAQAATIKLSKKSLTLEVGKTASLTVSGTKKAIKWSSSNKKVATVTSKSAGKATVKAITPGSAKITALVAGKKLICTVTVKNPANPYLKDAPFDAKEVQIGNIDMVIPADWSMSYNLMTNGISAAMKPNDTTNQSYAAIAILPNNDGLDYDAFKTKYSSTYTQDYFNQVYTKSLGKIGFEVTGIEQSDLSTSFGTVLKTEYTLKVSGLSLVQQIYDFPVDNYFIEIATNNVNEHDLSSMIEYVINSVIIKK